MKARQASGAPSFCWHCGLKLQRAPGRGKGLFYFQIVRDRVGIDHRVHAACAKDATADGDTKLIPEHA